VARTQIPECRLCGTWVLVDRIDRTAAGQVLEEPNLGADPIAELFGVVRSERAYLATVDSPACALMGQSIGSILRTMTP
jgi:hypothetical protein